jgi:hypothetical protein
VAAAINAAEAIGWVTCIDRSAHRGKAREYALTIPQWWITEMERGTPRVPLSTGKGYPSGGERGTRREGKGVPDGYHHLISNQSTNHPALPEPVTDLAPVDKSRAASTRRALAALTLPPAPKGKTWFQHCTDLGSGDPWNGYLALKHAYDKGIPQGINHPGSFLLSQAGKAAAA